MSLTRQHIIIYGGEVAGNKERQVCGDMMMGVDAIFHFSEFST